MIKKILPSPTRTQISSQQLSVEKSMISKYSSYKSHKNLCQYQLNHQSVIWKSLFKASDALQSVSGYTQYIQNKIESKLTDSNSLILQCKVSVKTILHSFINTVLQTYGIFHRLWDTYLSRWDTAWWVYVPPTLLRTCVLIRIVRTFYVTFNRVEFICCSAVKAGSVSNVLRVILSLQI